MEKICVAGIGAIGGLISAMLGKKYAEELSLIARGAKKEALLRQGIVLHSEVYGELVSRANCVTETGDELGVQDFVFVCVKNYALDEIAKNLRPVIGRDTVVIPILNGIEAGDRMREHFPDAIVCDGVIYTITAANQDGSMTQTGPYTTLYLGSKIMDERHQTGARRAVELLKSVDFDVHFSDLFS